MKISTVTIFRICLISFAFVGMGRSYCQEAGSPSFELYDMEPATVNERVLSTPGETIEPVKPTLNTSNINIKKTAVKRDSSTVRLPAVKPQAAPARKQDQEDEDDSVLSFNFLYYLIERYKMQDIVD